MTRPSRVPSIACSGDSQYLDKRALADYISALEGGLRDAVARKTVATGSQGAGIGIKVIEGQIERAREQEDSYTLNETPPAQFERFRNLAAGDPEASGWVEIMDAETEIAGLGIGAVIEIECELYIPELIKALAPGGMTRALDQLEAMMPFMEAFGGLDGVDTSGLPSRSQMDAVRGISAVVGADLVVVGEIDGTDWKIAGQLSQDGLNGDVEGISRVVGKVSTRWPEDHWKPLLALPGSSLLPRAQRRALERTRPSDADQGQYLEGPALMLDILAIYR